MNDRYLFRAKRKYWKQLPKEMWWVEGYLYGIWERRYILWGMINDVPNMVEVDESTICQCTGLKDKNGKLIWENDILNSGNLVVTWREELASYCLTKKGWMYQHFFGEAVDACDCEVIGNIFDNPELMHE